MQHEIQCCIGQGRKSSVKCNYSVSWLLNDTQTTLFNRTSILSSPSNCPKLERPYSKNIPSFGSCPVVLISASHPSTKPSSRPSMISPKTKMQTRLPGTLCVQHACIPKVPTAKWLEWQLLHRKSRHEKPFVCSRSRSLVVKLLSVFLTVRRLSGR